MQSVDELVAALLKNDTAAFNKIIRSIDLSVDDFEGIASWSEASYTRNCIAENEKFELILLCWEQGQVTPIHDHGGEECWVRIIEGEFKEIIYRKDSEGQPRIFKTNHAEAGDCTYMVDFMGFHSLENVSNNRSMSLHLYAKPIRNCNVYDEDVKEFVPTDLVYDTVQ